jgi:predicted DNA-binding transcriptional regulator YafY
MPRDPETKRIARLLDMIWMISLQPRQWSRRRLAGHFEVSEKTIQNDFAILRHGVGLQVESDYGRGYFFRSLPKLPSVSYSLSEALALILAAYAARQVGGVPQEDLSAAIARLIAVIPAELQPMVQRLTESPPVPVAEHRQATLRQLSQAAGLNQSVELHYAAASRDGEISQRVVDPYVVVPYGRSWHLIGYCHLRQDLRMFKIDRVREVKPLETPFQVRPDFDLSNYLSEGWGLMRGLDVPAETVTLLFQPMAARWVAEEHWHASQRVAWRSDGSLVFQVEIQITPEFQRWVFRYGREVEVLQPEHLRAWVLDEAEAVLARTSK